MLILTLLSSLMSHKCADGLHLVAWTPATQPMYLVSALGTKAEVLVATLVAIQAIPFAVLRASVGARGHEECTEGRSLLERFSKCFSVLHLLQALADAHLDSEREGGPLS